MLLLNLIKFIINFIYYVILSFYKPLEKRFFLRFIKIRFNIKEYLWSILGYNDSTIIIFIVKLIILYPLLKIGFSLAYFIFVLLIELYYGLLDGLFSILFDVILFFEKFEIVNRNRILLYLKIKIDNFLKKIKVFLSFQFLKINREDLYIENFLLLILDNISLFFVKIIDILLDVKFIVRVRKFFLFFRRVFTFVLKWVMRILFIILAIMFSVLNFLYLKANFKFIRTFIRIYKKFLKIPNIILTEEEKALVLKMLSKDELDIIANTKADFVKPLVENADFKKKIVWSEVFLIFLYNIIYFISIVVIFNVFVILLILIHIYAILSFIFDFTNDTMQDIENFTDFEVKEIEDKIEEKKKEIDEKYIKYYKFAKLDDKRYRIHNYYTKKDD